MDELPSTTGERLEKAARTWSRRDPAIWLATGLGIGLVSPAPGTFGALWGLLLAWGLAYLQPPLVAVVVVVALLVIGVPLCTSAARKLGGKDPQVVVWDELSTVPIVFWLVPLTNWKIAVFGFFLHRLFDITKPWPCNRLERLSEGLGIMADDVAASLYAAAALWGVMRAFE